MFMRNTRPPTRAGSITAGGSCCYAIGRDGFLYFWGITKKAGEAAMRPSLFEPLQGWPVHTVACGMSSTIMAGEEPYADDKMSLITFGPSPTFGELGYGDWQGGKKSSTVPVEVPSLKGGKVIEVCMGLGHSCAIFRDSDAKTQALLDALPVLEATELADDQASSSSSSGSSAAGGKKKAGEEEEEESEESEEESSEESEEESSEEEEEEAPKKKRKRKSSGSASKKKKKKQKAAAAAAKKKKKGKNKKKKKTKKN